MNVVDHDEFYNFVLDGLYPKNAWIRRYRLIKSRHFYLTLRESFNKFGQIFCPNFLENFHQVQI